MTEKLKLSILDLIPVRGTQTTGEALQASHALATRADQLGFTRYWVAEHHNMPSVASTTPGVELMYLGRDTHTMRLGSGGVMLPNHAPLAIAEQFSLLSAVYGDRIDLGIGRAPGTDPITASAMRGHLGQAELVGPDGKKIDPVENFPQHVMDILALLSPEGARVPLFGGKEQPLRPTPVPEAFAQLWLLGSSGYSAQLSAALGLPYVFANHFAGKGASAAMDLYRREFTATQYGDAPRSFMTANVVTAATAEEAWELAEPQLYTMSNLRVGAPLRTIPLVGDDVKSLITDGHSQVISKMKESWIIGDPQQCADQLRELAEEFDADEVMINPVAGSHPDEPNNTAAPRVATLELLAAELL